MSSMSTKTASKAKIVYTADTLKKLNVFMLRTIPGDDKYGKLRSFVAHFQQSNLTTVIRRPIAPLYLKERYGDQPQHSGHITRGGGPREHKEPSRRKLNNRKLDTIEDKTNDEIRNILSKISGENKNKLFNEFKKCNIIDECGDALIDNIYTFAIDLNYMVKIYVELIFLLKQKNEKLYKKLISKIVALAFNPLIFTGDEDKDAGGGSKSKRWRIANIKLLGEIYSQSPLEIDITRFKLLITQFRDGLSFDKHDNIEMLCELLKVSLPNLIKLEKDYIVNIMDILEPIGLDPKYELRHRFLVQDVCDIYNYDPEDDQ